MVGLMRRGRRSSSETLQSCCRGNQSMQFCARVSKTSSNAKPPLLSQASLGQGALCRCDPIQPLPIEMPEIGINRQSYHKHKILVPTEVIEEGRWRRVDDGYCPVRHDLPRTRWHLHANEPHPSAVLDHSSNLLGLHA